VRVISHKAIRDFVNAHPDALASLEHWYRTTLRAAWANLAETRQAFPHADLVGRVTVFNVGGGKYRLVARINYRTKRAFVRAILTHTEYDKGGWRE